MQVDCLCLDCSHLITVEMRDGTILTADPGTIVDHTNRSWAGPPGDWAGRRAQMNLFRSEEHAKSWSRFDPASADAIMPLTDWAAVFAVEGRKHLMDGDYLSRWLPRGIQSERQRCGSSGKPGPSGPETSTESTWF